MKILHTSDWHLGRSLYGRNRYNEFQLFLDWVIETLKVNEIDILIISGDIFDTTTPSNKAQELYYKFLYKASVLNCRHIIIISGNHDSPSFLKAPREILKYMNIHIVTSGDDISEQVLLLKNSEDQLEGVICCVPYLRDKDIRITDTGETPDQKNLKLVTGIKEHYLQVCSLGKTHLKKGIPIIGTGHLFATGARTIDGDGVRELYVGTLAHLGADIFPEYLDYVALGHIHIPQKIGGMDHIRYSGSPIPMGFGEANHKKIVVIIEFKQDEKVISEINVPTFQKLLRLTGNREEIITELKKITEEGISVWVEIVYNGEGLIGNLREEVFSITENSLIEILVIKNLNIKQYALGVSDQYIDLEELTVSDVFNKCLDSYNINELEKVQLKGLYNKIVKDLEEEDINS